MDGGEVRVGIWDKDCARKREKAGWVFDLRQPCQGREREDEVERERRCEGEREQLFKKEERRGREGEKAASKASGGHSPQGGGGRKAGKKEMMARTE